VTADGRQSGLPMVFLASGDYHHDLALNTLESAGSSPPRGHTGLYHAAFL
jgi:catechol 2,3-dioxygenase